MDIMEYVEALFGRKFWASALLFGAAILTIYYLHISYLPDPDVTVLVYLLLAAALAGAFIIVYIALATILPAVIWRGTIFGKKEYAAFKFGSKKSHSLLWWFGLPFVPTLISLMVIMLFDIGAGSYRGVFLGAGILSSITWLYVGLRQKKISGLKLKAIFIGTWILSWSMFAGSFLFVYAFVRAGFSEVSGESDHQIAWLYFFALLLMAVIGNVVVLEQPIASPIRKLPKKWRVVVWPCIVAIMLVAFIGLASRSWWVVPQMVMRAYGLGGDIEVSMVVNKDGQDAVQALDIPMDCKDGGACRVDNILLRSRLGSRYVLATKQSKKFTLPSAVILAIREKE